MAEPIFDVYDDRCPSHAALQRVGDRWTGLIVGLLAERPHRFGELRRRIGGISQKVLTQTLRSLERDGLVARRVEDTMPVTVEYSLSETGATLVPVLAAVRDWAETHVPEILAARARHDAGGAMAPTSDPTLATGAQAPSPRNSRRDPR